HEVARYLHARGRRKVAVVGGRDERSQRRMNAFAQECAALGMQQGRGEVPMYHVVAPTTLGQGRQGLAELLQAQPDLDAIFCSSDL
ncbi:substrate-binding domain-containing protein, partial [Acinetobacter baumannii]